MILPLTAPPSVTVRSMRPPWFLLSAVEAAIWPAKLPTVASGSGATSMAALTVLLPAGFFAVTFRV